MREREAVGRPRESKGAGQWYAWTQESRQVNRSPYRMSCHRTVTDPFLTCALVDSPGRNTTTMAEAVQTLSDMSHSVAHTGSRAVITSGPSIEIKNIGWPSAAGPFSHNLLVDAGRFSPALRRHRRARLPCHRLLRLACHAVPPPIGPATVRLGDD